MRRGLLRLALLSSIAAGALALAPASALAADAVIDSGPGNGETVHSSTATFTFHVQGANPVFECAVDDVAAYKDCGSPFTTPELKNGSHTFYVRVKDSGGGTNPAASRQWIVDATPPDVSIAKAPVLVEEGHDLLCGKTDHFSIASAAKKKPKAYCSGHFQLDVNLSCPADSPKPCEGKVVTTGPNGQGLRLFNITAEVQPVGFSIAPGATTAVVIPIDLDPGKLKKAARKAKKAAKKAARKKKREAHKKASAERTVDAEIQVSALGREPTKHPTKITVPDIK